jgi:hypothetical protein
MSEQSLKAYAVIENYESTGAIFFAKHAVTARRLGANEYADGDFSGVSCKRAKWADKYAGQVVPVSDLVAHGWRFECSGCGVTIDDTLHEWQERAFHFESLSDMLKIARRYRNWSPSDIIGHQHSQVFCDQRCKDEYEAHEAERKRRQENALQAMRLKVLKRFPNAQFSDDGNHAYARYDKGRWKVQQCWAAFIFDGMKYGPAKLIWDAPGSYRKLEKAHFTCCSGDKDAFEAWAKSQTMGA